MNSKASAVSVGRLSLFFVEMIIVLLFFALASVTVLRAFAASGGISEESSRLEKMSFCAQSAAELFGGTGSLSETARGLFGIDTGDADTVTAPLDDQCRYSPDGASLYMNMTVTEGARQGVYELHIAFSDKSGETLYEIKAGAYVPEKDGAGDE